MTSQGQRFRRRALRRGYKVDEVDTFLDRVEATLAGDSMGAPVSAQEVHDVVFRVRFGGYDEWQVDLHLDRVERQLAELEERGGSFGRPEPRSGELRMGAAADRMPPPDRMGQPDRMMPPERMMPDRMGPADRMGPGDRMGAGDRMGHDRMPPDRVASDRMGPDRVGPDRMGLDRVGPDRMGPDPVGPDRMAPDRMGSGDRTGQPSRMGPPDSYGPPAAAPATGPLMTGPGAPNAGPPSRAVPPGQPGAGAPPRDAGYGNRFDEPTYGGGFDTGGYSNVGRRGRNDMTTELRMGGGPGATFGGGPDPAFGGGTSPFSATEVARIDQLRRTFQVRRFGSGYDTAQVDRFFDHVVASLSGRTGVIVSDGELAAAHFNLVPGGYFEAEVDAAVKEVRDMVSRRR